MASIEEAKKNGVDISTDETNRVLRELNDTDTAYDKSVTICELFERCVSESGDAIAVTVGGESISYDELNQKANSLAWMLREKGVKPDDVVALVVDRSADLIVSLIAILKSGGAYLPIDPTYPRDRIEYILGGSGVKLMVTDKKDSQNLAPGIGILDIKDPGSFSAKTDNPPVVCSSTNLAYVIYTSGSTGKPKGVMIEHSNVVNFCKGISSLIEFGRGKKILGITTVSFDIFALETFMPLLHGGEIVLANEAEQMDSASWTRLIIDNNIEMLQVTPSRLRLFLSQKESKKALAQLKEVMVGGEAFPLQLLVELQQLGSFRIFNMYGPTETTVWSSVKDLSVASEVTIGKPIANTQMYVVSDDNELLQTGETGELCIAGDGLARGYINNPALTGERFIPNPFIPGTKMYKTGDLARMLPEADLEVIGRNDSQVKIRGYRVELKEIESVLCGHKAIKECVVCAFDDKTGFKYLAAYYISETEIGAHALREFTQTYLPDYMVPSIFIRLESFPFTPNGKLDRKALPVPETAGADYSLEMALAEVDVRQSILKIWMNLLPTKKIGVDENFFDVGGNSFLLVMMNDALNEMYPGKIEVAQIFAHPTVNMLASLIENGGRSHRQLSVAQLPRVEFPQSFRETGDQHDDLCFSFGIDRSVVEACGGIANDYGVSNYTVFVSMYLYLLSRVTRENKIGVCMIADHGPFVTKLVVDFQGIEDLSEVVVRIKEQIEKSENRFPVDSVRHLVVDRNEYRGLPLVICGNHESLGLSKVFDLVLKIKIAENGASIECDFEGSLY
jgi:amino acid adenylation domain-containing protein